MPKTLSDKTEPDQLQEPACKNCRQKQIINTLKMIKGSNREVCLAGHSHLHYRPTKCKEDYTPQISHRVQGYDDKGNKIEK